MGWPGPWRPLQVWLVQALLSASAGAGRRARLLHVLRVGGGGPQHAEGRGGAQRAFGVHVGGEPTGQVAAARVRRVEPRCVAALWIRTTVDSKAQRLDLHKVYRRAKKLWQASVWTH